MAELARLSLVLLLAAGLPAACGTEDEPVLGPIGVGEAGDRCEPEGGYACEKARVGGRRELRCADGVFVIHSSCPGGCVVAPDDNGSAYIICSEAPLDRPGRVVLPGNTGEEGE